MSIDIEGRGNRRGRIQGEYLVQETPEVGKTIWIAGREASGNVPLQPRDLAEVRREVLRPSRFGRQEITLDPPRKFNYASVRDELKGEVVPRLAAGGAAHLTAYESEILLARFSDEIPEPAWSIAERLGKTVTAINSTQSNAIRKLQRRMPLQ